MHELIPKWLNRFSLKIEDETKTMLLSEEDTNPDNVRFDLDGISVNSKIFICDKEYIVKNFELNSDMDIKPSNENISYGYGFDLHIIVEEV